jgi:hypothetical protein
MPAGCAGSIRWITIKFAKARQEVCFDIVEHEAVFVKKGGAFFAVPLKAIEHVTIGTLAFDD